ncbi:MAG: DUF4388 domain-containing protein [bacterium]
MVSDSKKVRLDEILVDEGLISQQQINEALVRQKAHGGKLGSQLLYHRYLDEAGLVRALTIQFGCEGVILSDVTIPPSVIGMIPPRIALARKVLPFAYDAKSRELKVACEDPTDSALLDELKFLTKENKLKLYVAAELSIITALAKYYEGRDICLEDNLVLDIPDSATESGPVQEPTETPEEGPAGQSQESYRGDVLLVTDEHYAGPMLQSLLERDNYRVTITDSADDAIEMIGGRAYHTVFIKDTVSGDYIDLIDRLRKSSPRTAVRYYESASSLLLSQETITAEGDLLSRNLELFTSLLALIERVPSNHSGAVGQYADKLCRRLGLPDKLRLQIVNAGYLHDLARYYYHLDQQKDQRAIIKLTTKLLGSINYPPVVVEMLHSMYKNLEGKYTKRLPVEILGGNILTIVDLYCENVDVNEKLALDRFEIIKIKYRNVTGKLLLGEVVDAFCHMIEDEILAGDAGETATQIMVCADNPSSLYPIERRLRREGHRTIAAYTIEAAAVLCGRAAPDFLVLQLHGEAGEIGAKVDLLIGLGIDIEQIPTFVLISGCAAAEVTSLIEKGVRDVQTFEVNLDLLVNGLQKCVEENKEKDASQRIVKESYGGTQGRLSDMNLIDLLQALGPSRKTVKIFATNDDNPDDRLLLYLDRGAVCYAELDQQVGAAAIHEAMTWRDGSWLVQPVAGVELPQANNDQPNEQILMEGCRLLDETTRSGSR